MLLNPNAHLCEICGEPRSKRVHRKCSRILQQQYDPKMNKRINTAILLDDMKDSMQRELSVRIRGRTKSGL